MNLKLPFSSQAKEDKNKMNPMISTSVKPDPDFPESQIVSAPEDGASVSDKIVKQAWYRMLENIERWRYALQYAENPILPQRLLLYRIYEEVWLDSNVRAQIELKKDRIKSVNFNLMAPDGTPYVEETKIFEADWFMKLLDFWVDEKFWGYTLIQIDGVNNRNHLGLTRIDPKYIVPERKEYKNNVYDVKGPSYNEDFYLNWLIEIGKNTDLGLFSALAPIVLWKRHCIQNWAQFQETFGMPVAIVQTKNKKPEEVEKLQNWLKNLGSRGWAIMDKDDELDFQSNSQSDAYMVFKEMISFCDSEIAKIIVGGDIDNGSKGGSYAQSKTKDRQSDIKTMSDLRHLEYWINEYIIPKILLIGIPIPDDAYLKFDKNQKLDLESQMKIDAQILKYYNVPAEYMTDKYGTAIDSEREEPLKGDFMPTEPTEDKNNIEE